MYHNKNKKIQKTFYQRIFLSRAPTELSYFKRPIFWKDVTSEKIGFLSRV